MKIRTSFLLLLALVLSGCMATNHATGKREFSFMSEEEEWSIGHKIVAKSIKDDGGLYREKPELVDYMKERMKDVVRVSELSDKPFRFNLVDSDKVNAYAIPGYVSFYRGILPFFENEAQMMSVMGHEVGHVTARHTARNHTKATIAGLLVNAVAIGVAQSTESTQAGELAGNLSVIAAQLGLAGYSRAYEAEADSLGVRYTSRLCYDAAEGAGSHIALGGYKELREKIRTALDPGNETKTVGYHGLFASHPESLKRAKSITEEAGEALNCGNMHHRERYLKMIDGIAFGPKLDDGVGSKYGYYHKKGRFVFEMPNSWYMPNMVGLPSVLTPAGNVHMKVHILSRPADERADEAMMYAFENASLIPERVKNQHNTEVYSATMVAYEDRGLIRKEAGMVRVLGFPVSKNVSLDDEKQKIAVITFRTEKDDFEALDKAFNQIAKSVQTLSGSQLKAMEPLRVKIHTVAAGETEESLSEKMAFTAFHKEWLRLLNGRDINKEAQFKAGEKVKLVIDPNYRP